MMFTDGTTLTSLLSPEDRRRWTEALDERGIPLASVAKMKPWMLSAHGRAAGLRDGAQGGRRAGARRQARAGCAGGRQEAARGWKRPPTSLRAMASLPMEFHIKGLVDTLKLGDRMDDVIETMIVLYAARRYRHVLAAVPRRAAGRGEDEAGYAAFEQTMITSAQQDDGRERRADPRRGNAFIAVGALHLPGPEA